MKRKIGKNGCIYIYDEFEGRFSKNLREFLLDTISNFANESMIFLRYGYDDYYPFVYNEKVLCSALLPALKKSTNTSIVLTEFPIERIKSHKKRKSDKNKRGYVDYLILQNYYNNDIEILMEVKFEWISYKNLIEKENIRDAILKKIEEASKQIKDIDWDNVIKIAMVIAPVYIKKTLNSEIECDKFLEKFPIKYEYFNINKFSNLIFYNKEKEILDKKFQLFLLRWDIPSFKDYNLWYWNENEKINCQAYPTIFFIGAVLK